MKENNQYCETLCCANRVKHSFCNFCWEAIFAYANIEAEYRPIKSSQEFTDIVSRKILNRIQPERLSEKTSKEDAIV